ncbi:MAG: helix-turn-helix domain-containing protein [Planctomycetaceae bacterium]|nr:helix-turn-helix domain-containing protein [Planctomycetaceae bacterium]
MTTETKDLPPVQTIDMAGERYVVLREADYCRLTGESGEPPLPEPNARGNYPARAAAWVIMARDILRSRQKLGLKQEELAALAGIRVETLCRLERGKHAPTVDTLEKLDRALKKAEARQAKKRT